MLKSPALTIALITLTALVTGCARGEPSAPSWEPSQALTAGTPAASPTTAVPAPPTSSPTLAAATGEGVIAFVSTRDGNGEIYVRKAPTTMLTLGRMRRPLTSARDGAELRRTRGCSGCWPCS